MFLKAPAGLFECMQTFVELTWCYLLLVVSLAFTGYTPPPANFDTAVGKPLTLVTSKKPSAKG